MTQKELLKQIRLKIERQIVEPTPHVLWTAQQILDLFNKHVKEVIGEDEKNKFQRDPSNEERDIRNSLRQEQRKRAEEQ